MKWFSINIIFFLLSLSVSSQNIEILDDITDDPIQHAQIDIVGKRMSPQYTDSFGKLLLRGTEPTDTILISYIGYKPLRVAVNSLKKTNNIILISSALINMPSIKIYGKSARENAISTPQKVKTLTAEAIKKIAPSNSASLLESTGSVMIQRSQQGGGSPIIRGFEANRVLLVIDGVRMNNAIYRSGHLQNAITVDPNILERTEVIFGTSSLIYGSDALGGVVHFHSIDPIFKDTNSVSVNSSIKYASAAQEKSAHIHFQLMGKKSSSLTSFTISDFGDLRMGSARNHNAEWGLVREYIFTDNNVDMIVSNDNPLIQKNTGYKQYDITQKLKFKLSEHGVLRANMQYSTTSNIPRFDRYNDYKNGVLKFAEWDYGPQQRMLVSVSTDFQSKKKWMDDFNITAAFQQIDEDRITRRFQSTQRYTRQEDVRVLSLNTDLVKNLKKKSKLYYGLEFTHNDVQSKAFITDIQNGEMMDALTRYPNGGSTFFTSAIYLSYLRPFKEKWQYNIGVRLNNIQSKSKFKENDFFNLPFESITLNNQAVTGSLGLKYASSKGTVFRILSSTGFRAPNIDDYGKVFDRDGYVVVPDDRLTPEYAINGEVGIAKKLLNNKLTVDASLFYTHLLDAIVQRDFQLQGEDSLSIDGEVSRIQSNQNASEARIYGYSLSLQYDFSPKIKFNAVGNYTYGEDIENESPMAHIPPFFAKGEISYHHKKVKAAFYTYYHDVKTRERIADGRTDNPNEGLDGQFPSWYTLNLRTSYTFTKNMMIQFGVENILDVHYKSFASGLSAPGKNFIIVIRAEIN